MPCHLFTLVNVFRTRPMIDHGRWVAQAYRDNGMLPLRPGFLGRTAEVALLASPTQNTVLEDGSVPETERVGHPCYLYAGTAPSRDELPEPVKRNFVGHLLSYPDAYRIVGRTAAMFDRVPYLGLFCPREDVDDGWIDGSYLLSDKEARLHRLHARLDPLPLEAEEGWSGFEFPTGEVFVVHGDLLRRYTRDECLDIAFQAAVAYGGDLKDHGPHRWVQLELPGDRTLAVLFRLADGRYRLHMGYNDVLAAGGYTPPEDAYPVFSEGELVFHSSSGRLGSNADLIGD